MFTSGKTLLSANVQIYRGRYWSGWVRIQVCSCVKVHIASPNLVSLLCTRSRRSGQICLGGRRRKTCTSSFSPGEGRRRGRILSVCMSCIRKWFFISETADPVRVARKVEAYILFQFAVLCFNNGHYYHYNFGISLLSVNLFFLFSLCKLDELETCSQSHISM